MSSEKQRAIAQFEALKANFVARLRSNPDYIAIQEIDRSIQRLAEIPSDSITHQTATNFAVDNIVARVSPTAKVKQGEASYNAIANAGIPLSIEELVPAVERAGAKLTGNKNVNLSSSLSRDDRFISVKWRGANKWWIVGRKLPDESPLLQLEAQKNSAPPAQAGEAVNGSGS